MEEIDLKRFAKLAMAKKVYIIIIMILAVTAGAIYTFSFVTPKYKAKTTLLLAQINEDKLNQNTLKQSEITDLSMTSTLLEPYISIIKSNKVAKKVIDNLNLDMNEEALQKILNVTEENTAMVAITIVSEDAEFSAKVANEVAKVFKEESQEIFNITNVNIIDVAEVEEKPYNVHHLKDLLIFILLGAFASCGVILILYMLDTTIKEEEDIENELGLPVLGVIPTYIKSLEKGTIKSSESSEVMEAEDTEEGKGKHHKKNKKRNKKIKNNELVILGNTKSPVSEAFRILRTNITFSPNTKTILITSCVTSDGKSYITANLATAIAKVGKKVIIVDSDMRKGRQNRIFEISNKLGLSNYLANIDERRPNINNITSYIKETKIPNLHVMTSGSRPSNPSELLTPAKIQGLLSVLQEIYDIVILDGSPSNLIADSIAIAKFVDYTLLIASHKSTKIEDAKRVIKNFEQVGGKIKGAVLNKYPLTKEEYTTTYYYDHEKNVPRLKEIDDDDIKSVKEFVDEAKFKKNSFEEKGIERQELIKEPEVITTPIQTESNSILEYKIEKIDSELGAMKNILMQIAMSNNQISTKDIEIIRYDIKSLKDSIDEVNNYAGVEAIKKDIESTKELAESLVKTQQENSEKVKKFIENYYKNKNRKEDK